MRVAFSSMASKIGPSSPGEELITPRTSEVAACCSRASRSSRVSRATSVFWPAAEDLRLRTLFGALRQINVLRRFVFTAFLPVLARRLIASPEPQDNSWYRLKPVLGKGWLMSALGHKRTYAVQKAMSALAP